MLTQVFEILAPLLVIAAVGFIYGAKVQPQMADTNRLIMDVFMPALILHVMLKESFKVADYAQLVLGGFGVIFLSGVVALVVAKAVGFEWRSFVPPAMFSNWANLGLPLYVFALGEAALDGGVMLVVAGNIACFTIGIYIYSGRVHWLEVIKTPVLIAVMIGLLFSSFEISVPKVVNISLSMLGQVTIPLMLFSLGVRLTKVKLSDSLQGIVMAVLCPVAGVTIALLLVSILDLSELHRDILILFGVLPPAVINFMLAEQYQRNPVQVASMVMIGNLAALISVPLVLYWLILP